MRKNLWIIIFICFLLIGLGFSLWMNFSDSPIDKQTSGEPQINFAITERGNEYLHAAREGSPVGRMIPTSLFVGSLGQDLLQCEKKSLVIYNQNKYKKYLPLIQEWARIYHDQLTIILVTSGGLTNEERNRLIASGLHVVFDSDGLRAYLDPGPLNYSFFLDENQKVVHRFTFEEYKWREMVRDIDLFARQSVVPEQVVQKPMELGKPLTLSATLASGKMFNITDFQGKPSVFFLINPLCPVCDQLYPLIRSLKTRNNGNLNVGIIFSVYNYQTDQLVKEFYDRYGLGHENMENMYIENMKRFVSQNQLDDLKIFFDQNNRFFHQDLFWMVPTVLIVDKDLILKDIFGITGGNLELPVLDQTIQEMIDEVL